MVQTPSDKYDRIVWHWYCPCKDWKEMRFHLRGILREFRPRGLWQRRPKR